MPVESDFRWEQLTGRVTLATVTIANGAALSEAAVLGPRLLLGISTPAVWTAASLSFDVAFDDAAGATFLPMGDRDGELLIASASIPTGRAQYFALNPGDWRAVQQVKVRSGSATTPANQGGARVITLYLGVI